MASSGSRRWLVDIVAGGVTGGVVGAIVAWNIAIYLGVPGGYQSSIRDVFAHSVPVGVLWVAALVSGPLVGIALARRLRRKAARPPSGEKTRV